MRVQPDHIIKLRTNAEKLCLPMIMNAANILAESLDINFKLRIERKTGFKVLTQAVASSYKAKPNRITINVQNLYGQSFETILHVLAHEVRHVVQSQHGQLEHTFPALTQADVGWNASPDELFKLNSPVMRDAIAHQENYAAIVRSHKDWMHEHTMSLSLDGDTMIDDYYNTMISMGLTPEDTYVFHERQNVSLFWFNIDVVEGYDTFTPRAVCTVRENYRKQLLTQPFTPIKRHAVLLDLVS